MSRASGPGASLHWTVVDSFGTNQYHCTLFLSTLRGNGSEIRYGLTSTTLRQFSCDIHAC